MSKHPFVLIPSPSMDHDEYQGLYLEACRVAREIVCTPIPPIPDALIFEICWGREIAEQIMRERQEYQDFYALPRPTGGGAILGKAFPSLSPGTDVSE